MTNREKYLQLRKDALKFAYENNEQQYQQKANEAVRFRNENFTKEDWLELIEQSHGRAFYEYTKMMQEKYPD